MEHLRYTDKQLWEKITENTDINTISIKHENHYHTISRDKGFFTQLGIEDTEHYEDLLKGLAMILHDTEETECKKPYHIENLISGISKDNLYRMLSNEIEPPEYERYVRHYTEEEIEWDILKKRELEKAKSEVGKPVNRKCYYITEECVIDNVSSDIEHLEPFHNAFHITQPTPLLDKLSDGYICEIERLYDYPTYWKGEYLIVTSPFEEFMEGISSRFEVYNNLEELRCTTKEKNIS